MAKFFGLGSRNQKGTPVKFEFEILVQEIKPWGEAQSQTAPMPVILSWRRGDKRSGSTKSVSLSGGGGDGGTMSFNESFKLPATLFEKKAGHFMKKCVTFTLHDDTERSAKVSRPLASAELDLAEFSGLTSPRNTSVPLDVGAGVPTGVGAPTLYLRISPMGRNGSTLSLLNAGSRVSAGSSRQLLLDQAVRNNLIAALESEDDGDNQSTEIDSFTDDEESPRSTSSIAEMKPSAVSKAESNRDKLFAPVVPVLRVPPSKVETLKAIPQPVVPSKAPSAAPKPSADGCSAISSHEKVPLKQTENKVRKPTEEEKRHNLLGLNLPPGKSLAAAGKTVEAAAASAGKTVEAVAASAGKTVEAAAASAGKTVEAVVASAGKTVEAAAASAGKTVEAAAASAGKSVAAAAALASAAEKSAAAAAAAAAAYASKKAAKTKEDGSSSSSSLDFSAEPMSPPPEGINTSVSSVVHSPVSKLLKQSSPSLLSIPSAPPVVVPSISTFQEATPGQQGTPGLVLEQREEIGFVGKRFLATGDEGSGKSVLGEARAKLAMVEKRAIEELRSKVAAAEAKAVLNQEKGDERARILEQRLMKLEDELRDSAAIEVALYSVVAEHGSSSHKVHTPARRLARLYVHAFKNWSPERRASSARNSVLGLVLVVRACGNDVPRLTYWWSNLVVLRESVMQACNVESSTPKDPGPDNVVASTSTSGQSFAARATRSQQLRKRLSRQDSSQLLSPKGVKNDWRECSTFVGALLRVEEWSHGRILECVWWQAMTPVMQIGGSNPTASSSLSFVGVKEEFNKFAVKVKDGLGELNKFAGDVKEFFTKERGDGGLSQLGDARQGNISVEIWKNAFTDAQKRLCPLQGHDAECGCLPVLSRTIIAECVERLDVAMLNGIMRNPEDDSPTDPLADPITDLSVLPIPAGTLTFGAGSQLKNVAVTWSTWLSTLLSVKDPSSAETSTKDETKAQAERAESPGTLKTFSLLKATGELLMLPKDMILDMAMRREAARKETEKATPYFVLLRAAGDLLMLPKDMLMDKSVRREVCPQLSLPLIRRILSNFVPDEFSPDPVSPALLAAINAEVSIERQKHGEAELCLDDMSTAPVPPVIYIPPSSGFVRLWIGEPPGADQWGKSTSSLLRKGYTSDDELEEFQTPLAWLKDSPNTRHGSASYGSDFHFDTTNAQEETGAAGRYQLLKEVWGAT